MTCESVSLSLTSNRPLDKFSITTPSSSRVSFHRSDDKQRPTRSFGENVSNQEVHDDNVIERNDEPISSETPANNFREVRFSSATCPCTAGTRQKLALLDTLASAASGRSPDGSCRNCRFVTGSTALISARPGSSRSSDQPLIVRVLSPAGLTMRLIDKTLTTIETQN